MAEHLLEVAGVPPTTVCGVQLVPPFVVATITVLSPAGMVALGPGTPTAQQRSALAQATAPN